jgi:hypothetical protein
MTIGEKIKCGAALAFRRRERGARLVESLAMGGKILVCDKI